MEVRRIWNVGSLSSHFMCLKKHSQHLQVSCSDINSYDQALTTITQKVKISNEDTPLFCYTCVVVSVAFR